jgi:hypothetical protein
MKLEAILGLCFALALTCWSTASQAQKTQTRIAQSKECAQVISCGTKDGKRKEYPTPCDAEKDGATDIKPKTGPTCEQSR